MCTPLVCSQTSGLTDGVIVDEHNVRKDSILVV